MYRQTVKHSMSTNTKCQGDVHWGSYIGLLCFHLGVSLVQEGTGVPLNFQYYDNYQVPLSQHLPSPGVANLEFVFTFNSGL